jgi:hypothetical protein
VEFSTRTVKITSLGSGKKCPTQLVKFRNINNPGDERLMCKYSIPESQNRMRTDVVRMIRDRIPGAVIQEFHNAHDPTTSRCAGQLLEKKVSDAETFFATTHPERVVQVLPQNSMQDPPQRGSDIVQLFVNSNNVIKRIRCGRSIPAAVSNLSTVFRVYFDRTNDQVIDAYTYSTQCDSIEETPTPNPGNGGEETRSPFPDQDIDQTTNVNITIERDSYGNIIRGDPFMGLGLNGFPNDINIGAINQNFASDTNVSGGGMTIGDAVTSSPSSPPQQPPAVVIPPLPAPPPPMILEEERGTNWSYVLFATCLGIALCVSAWLLYKNFIRSKNSNNARNVNAARENTINTSAPAQPPAANTSLNVPSNLNLESSLPNENTNDILQDFDFESTDTFPNNNNAPQRPSAT